MNTVSKLILVIKTIVNFHTAVLDRLGLLHGEVIYSIRNKDLKFIARSGTEDLAEIAVIASGSEYKLDLIDLPDSPVIVDLGGHIGTFSIPMARLYSDSCRIYTFEPEKENYKLLKRNIALNKVKSIQPINMAISDYVGSGLLKNDTNNTDSFYLDFSKSSNSNCTVSTLQKALSPYHLKNIDVLKIDIEGGEYKVLLDKKTYEFIQKKVRYMMLEYHPIDNYYNYSLIKKIINNKFRILNKPKNVLVLENVHWKATR